MLTDINFFILSLIVISFQSIILLCLNLFQVPLALTSGILISVLSYQILHSFQIIRPKDKTLFKYKTHGFTLAVIILAALLFRAEPYLWIMGGQDQGTYVNMSAYWGENKTVFPIDSVRDSIESKEVLRYYDKANKSFQRKTKQRIYLPGIFSPEEDSKYVFQFYPLHALWMAIFGKLFGSDYRVYALSLFSILSILFFYFLAYEISENRLIASVSGLLLALNPLHAFFSKLPVTEAVALFFTTASFLYLLKYYNASKNDDSPIIYLILSAGLMSCYFFTRISGFMYIPFIGILLFTAIIFVDDQKIKRNLSLYFSVLLIAYTLSILYGMIFSRPYSTFIYVDSFIEALGDRPRYKIKLMTGSAIAAIIFIYTTYMRRSGQRSIKKVVAIIVHTLPYVFVLVLAAGLYKAYQLGFTTKYLGHPFFDVRWHMQGLGFYSAYFSSVIVASLYISPFMLGLFLYNLFTYQKDNNILSLLLLFILPFWLYIAVSYWTIPYQYFYARYLLTEIVPYTILFAMVASSTLLRKKRPKRIVLTLFAVAGCYFVYFSAYQLNGREADGAFDSLSEIAYHVDDNDLIFLNTQEFKAHVVIKTPLVYFYGKKLFSIDSAGDLDYLLRQKFLEKYNDIFILTQYPISKDYLRLKNEVTYTQGLFEHAASIPIQYSYDFFAPLKLMLFQVDNAFWAKDMLHKAKAIEVQSWYGRKGFHSDAIWTKGDAELFGFELNPNEINYIVIATYGWNPNWDNLEELGLKLMVNGIEAEFSHTSDGKYYFNIPKVLDRLSHLKIMSRTFIPEKLGINDDQRVCGIDIKSVSFE